MEKQAFGSSGLKVTPLGFGAGQIGGSDQSEAEIEKLLHSVLDLGINLIDTARGYGESEARIGKYLKGRRDQCLYSTKIGYGVPGFTDWTAAGITAGVDYALKLMQTDWLDIVHLHSCPLETLQAGAVVEALQKAVQAGKVRVMAYSGENEPLAWAIQSGYFGSIMTSINLCDQQSLHQLVPQAQERGLGIIAKRPLANAFWRFNSQPHGDYAETYWLRWQSLGLWSDDLPMADLAIRFAAFAPGVSSCVVGSRQWGHLQTLKSAIEQGPLDADTLSLLHKVYSEIGQNWRGEV
ncbi:MAG: aldo/keto reductase [Candidatus Sericytochromatia bacterium]